MVQSRIPLTALLPRDTERGLSPAWPLAIIALVLYGSLIPFHFNGSSFGMSGIDWRSTTLDDVATNLLLYVPIGFALAGTTRNLHSRHLTRFVFAVMGGVLVSIVAEAIQTGIAVRVASWTDVVLNVIGTIVGALVAPRGLMLVRALGTTIRIRLQDRTFATLAQGLTVGLFFYGLAPFDFITNTQQLRGVFRQAAWSFSSTHNVTVATQDLSGLLAQLPGTLWFAALGYLFTLAARQRGDRAMHALGSAMKHGFILAGLLEVMQLFTLSHQFEPVAMALHWLAVAVGAWGGTLIVDDISTDDWKRFPALAAPRSLLTLLALFQVLFLFGSAVMPEICSLQAADWSRLRWIPFEGLWHLSISSAAIEALTAAITFGVLALTIAMILRHSNGAAHRILTSTLVLSLAIVAEVLQAYTVSRTPDLTGPFLALGTLIMLFGMMRKLQPKPRTASQTPR